MLKPKSLESGQERFPLTDKWILGSKQLPDFASSNLAVAHRWGELHAEYHLVQRRVAEVGQVPGALCYHSQASCLCMRLSRAGTAPYDSHCATRRQDNLSLHLGLLTKRLQAPERREPSHPSTIREHGKACSRPTLSYGPKAPHRTFCSKGQRRRLRFRRNTIESFRGGNHWRNRQQFHQLPHQDWCGLDRRNSCCAARI